jgi:glycine cleavage system aminomethyltransferase T
MSNDANLYFKHSPYIPYDPDAFTYVESEGRGGPATPDSVAGFHPYEYEQGWEKEMLSWHDSCYLHAGLNPTATYKIKGPEALKLLSDVSVNSFANFKVGRAKHVIMCNDEGKIIIHGMVVRLAEDEFETFWLWPYLEFALKEGGYDAVGENLTGKVFLYQLGGPRSLEIAETAVKGDLHDIRFLDWRDSEIAGKKVSVFRIGMAGTLAYEIHGRLEDALPVYDALLKAGESYGLVKMGRRAYRVVHTEAGFPQSNYHFPFAMREGYPEFLQKLNEDGNDIAPLTFTGSMDPDINCHIRNPIEVGWAHMVKFDHVFIGRAALEKEIANPKRQMVMLEWDHEDVVDIYRSQFDKENSCSTMQWVEDYNPYLGSSEYHDDKVVAGDKEIGISSGRMFSPHYREMISICSIDTEYSKLGTKVEIIWGERRTKQKRIRATVARFPYIHENRNENVDVSTIPRRFAKS